MNAAQIKCAACGADPVEGGRYFPCSHCDKPCEVAGCGRCARSARSNGIGPT